MRLSIIVPAYNEEARLGRMLDVYLPYFTRLYDRDFEMLIVVNGSRDRTEDIGRDYARRHAPVRVMVEPCRIGKGGALMLGFAQAGGELVGFVDADGATPPEMFQELANQIGDAGAIIASRWCRGAVVSPRQPLSRRAASRLFNLLVRILFRLSISDTQCGAKLLTRAAVQAVLPRLGTTQWAFDVDLLFQLRRAGFAIRETPTVWRDVSGSRLQLGRAALDMMLAIVRLRLIYSPFKWLVKVYDRLLGRYIPYRI